mgnify:CR=1 FL=1
MNRYSVMFSAGYIGTRSSNRVYTHAWCAMWSEAGKPQHVVGFSISRQCAESAAGKFRKHNPNNFSIEIKEC